MVVVSQADDVFFVRRIGGIGVLPNFGDNSPRIEAHEAVAIAKANRNVLTWLKNLVVGRELISGVEYHAYGVLALYHPFLAAARVILPREFGVGGDDKNFWLERQALLGLSVEFVGQAWEKLMGKLTCLRWINDKEPTPRALKIFVYEAKAKFGNPLLYSVMNH